jgi:hypothetical protein
MLYYNVNLVIIFHIEEKIALEKPTLEQISLEDVVKELERRNFSKKQLFELFLLITKSDAWRNE